jgi:hypothetical protein
MNLGILNGEKTKKKKKLKNVGKKGNVAAVKQAFGFLT